MKIKEVVDALEMFAPLPLQDPKNNKKYVSNINISQKICIFA